jgi:hypothetical protein
MEKTVFQTLSEIDITSKIKKKNKMDYLPWSSAWDFIKNTYPNAAYRIVNTENGCIYHNDGKTCWVETEVTIEDEIQTEVLPVLDYRNQAIGLDKVTSSDVNKSIKRCLVKNLALFGLGLSLWNGEELSDNAKKKKADVDEALRNVQKNIINILKNKVDEGCDKAKLFVYVENLIGSKNPSNVKDIEKLNKSLEIIKAVTPKTLEN